MLSIRLNGARLRQEYQAKLEAEERARGRGRESGIPGYNRAGFDVTVEGVTISGPLETPGEIRVAMEQDWRSADIGGGSRKHTEDVTISGENSDNNILLRGRYLHHRRTNLGTIPDIEYPVNVCGWVPYRVVGEGGRTQLLRA